MYRCSSCYIINKVTGKEGCVYFNCRMSVVRLQACSVKVFDPTILNFVTNIIDYLPMLYVLWIVSSMVLYTTINLDTLKNKYFSSF